MILPILQISFLSVTGILLFYYLFYFLRIPILKQPNLLKEPAEGISIVVCAHNELENLKELVPLLLAQDHPRFEVIVVDDRSSDGTYDYLTLQKIANPLLRICVIDQTPDNFDGKKYALTLGIKAAKYDQVLLTDADCRPASDSWARAMSNSFDADTQVVLGYSHYEKSAGGLLDMLIGFETLLTGVQYISSALTFRPYMGVGRNLAYRKSFFLAKKGFHGFMDRVGGDDDLFINRYAKKASTNVAIGDELLVWSKPAKDWKKYFSQKVRHLFAGKAYNSIDRFRLGLYQLCVWLFWIGLAALVFFMPDFDYTQPLWIATLAVFFVRLILFYVIFVLSARKFGLKIALWWLPFAEIFYSVYYVIVGLSAQFSKTVRW
jgi:glycosyltransferase involved in cell wall biosynthesis